MDEINIIIIGGKNNQSFNENDIETFNNPNQAKQSDIFNLNNILNDKKINVYCFDKYNGEYIQDNVIYFNSFFTLGDTKYLNKNAHNIVIEFCNMLDENFINHENNKQNDKLMNYSDYKFTWIACGCSWDKGFPSHLIYKIVNDKYYTPINAFSINSFLNAIVSSNRIKDNKKDNTMKPYSQGIYQSLGTILYRGCESDYSSENILFELFNIIEPQLSSDEMIEFEKFLNKEIHWNRLTRNIRIKLTSYIYGDNIELNL